MPKRGSDTLTASSSSNSSTHKKTRKTEVKPVQKEALKLAADLKVIHDVLSSALETAKGNAKFIAVISKCLSISRSWIKLTDQAMNEQWSAPGVAFGARFGPVVSGTELETVRPRLCIS